LIATGDNDLLAPWFNMYVQALPLVKDRTQAYFHHDGGAFIETMYFWGLPNVNDFGWNNQGTELQSEWMRYHIQGGLEVIAQMLDNYDYTQDTDFVRNSLFPMADAVITYYDQHWQRGSDGKILMEPSQAIETYQRDAANPTPDIAGLMSVLPRLLSLPPGLADETQRNLWNKVLKDLPPLPMGTTANGKLPPKGKGDPDGKRVILPAEKYGNTKNSENPELYTVFPYSLYGVGKPDLELARDTYAARLFRFSHCWGQDGVEAAALGLADQAKKTALEEFTCYGNQQFRWFWGKSNDWIPDMDNGGAGMSTLQLMLMQCDGKRIQLLPAWPDDWTADFKLHAPYQTTVEGHVEHGKVTRLKVIPAERAKDVVVVNPQAN
jgi:alpha-L-fucosidase 2